MEQTNIKRFDDFVGLIFGELYVSFPISRDVILKQFFEKNCIEALDNEYLVFSETMFWLKMSGYITFANPAEKIKSGLGGISPSPVFKYVVLTSKGLEILKKTPVSVSLKETLGDNIIEALKEGSLQKVRDLASTALSFGINLNL